MREHGRIIDHRYRIERQIGDGGMSAVYEAEHVLTHQRVALKVLYERSTNELAYERFRREVDLTARFQHPNVVRVFDAGRDDELDALYLAMELLVGEDLETKLLRGVTRRQALSWLREILPALSLAHESGFIHRDLKPGNLFLAETGDDHITPKLLDFGIARPAKGPRVTQDDAAIGTPEYMSPEQALKPKLIDHRADIWALGAMVYELVVGETPFHDETPHAVIHRASSAPHLPLAQSVPEVSPRLADLVDLCLSKEPDSRPSSVEDLDAALVEVLAEAEGGWLDALCPAGQHYLSGVGLGPSAALAVEAAEDDVEAPGASRDDRSPEEPESTRTNASDDDLLPAPAATKAHAGGRDLTRQGIYSSLLIAALAALGLGTWAAWPAPGAGPTPPRNRQSTSTPTDDTSEVTSRRSFLEPSDSSSPAETRITEDMVPVPDETTGDDARTDETTHDESAPAHRQRARRRLTRARRDDPSRVEPAESSEFVGAPRTQEPRAAEPRDEEPGGGESNARVVGERQLTDTSGEPTADEGAPAASPERAESRGEEQAPRRREEPERRGTLPVEPRRPDPPPRVASPPQRRPVSMMRQPPPPSPMMDPEPPPYFF